MVRTVARSGFPGWKMAAGLTHQESLKQYSQSLKIGDTVLLFYNAEKRANEEVQRSGYVLSDFSR